MLLAINVKTIRALLLLKMLLLLKENERVKDVSTKRDYKEAAEATDVNTLLEKEVRKCYAAKQVKDALKRKNGLITEHTLDLFISLRVFVWQENQRWKGSFQLLSKQGHTCIVACPRLTEFRSTLIKPYYFEVEKLLEELQKYDLSIPTVLDEEEGDSYVLFIKDSEVFITDKERRDYKLLVKLRAERIIKSFGAPF
ncbi:hypothetical protein MBM_01456 [Drepanopeziza brunnea f. sp. 'multigermtubi' MB_m1]|uniref:Uncharacterized protein n=1 Tax=Marssonina brunnea f. sp. multigermtubi (strain MB_m1) TaxID=1072389 RepID=K1Y6E0_MARBU|nr:uncharacterized protein MBM_01456 [Drepanopeziza brunnea f. sp. 'multigermtubi' MB_m1]EKD20774.1 hypothetical protein MBM_01456 [Drepanopeziza brunnea f. sp. 'multigermtubi' MB_m1]